MKKRPSFTAACQWVATEDNPGENQPPEELAGTLCVCLVADMWGCDPRDVAQRVWGMRNNENDAFYVGN